MHTESPQSADSALSELRASPADPLQATMSTRVDDVSFGWSKVDVGTAMERRRFSMTVFGKPISAPRPRVAGGRAYYEPDYAAWKKTVGDYASYYTNGVPDLPWRKPQRLVAEVWVYGQRDDQDADNLAKAMMDALNGKAYDDDSQIKNLEVNEPCLECMTALDPKLKASTTIHVYPEMTLHTCKKGQA